MATSCAFDGAPSARAGRPPKTTPPATSAPPPSAAFLKKSARVAAPFGIDRVGGLLDGAVGVERREGDVIGHVSSVNWVVEHRGLRPPAPPGSPRRRGATPRDPSLLPARTAGDTTTCAEVRGMTTTTSRGEFLSLGMKGGLALVAGGAVLGMATGPALGQASGRRGHRQARRDGRAPGHRLLRQGHRHRLLHGRRAGLHERGQAERAGPLRRPGQGAGLGRPREPDVHVPGRHAGQRARASRRPASPSRPPSWAPTWAPSRP